MREKLEIRPSGLFYYLALLGSIGFVVASAWIIWVGAGGLLGIFAGSLGVGFFGWLALYMIDARLKGKRRGLVLTPDGLHISCSLFYNKFVPWADLEAGGVYTMGNQKFNVLALRDVEPLIAQMSDDEKNKSVRMMRRLKYFAKAAGAPDGGLDENAEHLREFGNSEINSMQDAFAYHRNTYGGEILLGWADRDRSAEKLNALLIEWSAKYGGAR